VVVVALAGFRGEEFAGADSANGASVLEDLAYCEEKEIGRIRFLSWKDNAGEAVVFLFRD
jgi:hypothetical protein